MRFLRAISILFVIITSCTDLNDNIFENNSSQSDNNTNVVLPTTKASLSNKNINNNPEQAFPNQKKTEVNIANCLLVEQVGNRYVYQGDIVLDREQVDSLASAIKNVQKGTVVNNYIKYWPKHKVYYVFESGFVGQSSVLSAINEWQLKTGLDFVYGTGYGNYIEFQNNIGDGNYSNSLGMKGGQQIISLQTGSFSIGNAIHEIGHAIGLLHEHCRPDRDNYITVNYSNILNGHASQFDKSNISDCMTIGAFDFNSVMLYHSWAFSSNNQPTITKKDGSVFSCQRDSLSTFDAEAAKAIYGPPYHALVATVFNSYYQDYGVSEEWMEEKSYNICFFSDKACTIPASLQYDRKFHVQHTTVRITGGVPEYYYDSSDIIVPAGTSSYNVGCTLTSMHSEYGIESGVDEYYSITY